MRVQALVVLLAALGLLAIWSFVTTAQVIDSPPCQQACYEQKTACVSACGTHDNPVECEERCDDQLEGCLRECG